MQENSCYRHSYSTVQIETKNFNLLLSVNCGTRVISFHNQFTLAVRAVTHFRIRRKRIVYTLKSPSFLPLQQPVHNLRLIPDGQVTSSSSYP